MRVMRMIRNLGKAALSSRGLWTLEPESSNRDSVDPVGPSFTCLTAFSHFRFDGRFRFQCFSI